MNMEKNTSMEMEMEMDLLGWKRKADPTTAIAIPIQTVATIQVHHKYPKTLNRATPNSLHK